MVKISKNFNYPRLHVAIDNTMASTTDNILDNTLEPPLIQFNGHLQTIIPSVFRKVDGINYQRERIDTPDDDFLDLDWSLNGSAQLVIISHGLEGSSDRSYVKGMVASFDKMGWDSLAWNRLQWRNEPAITLLPQWRH